MRRRVSTLACAAALLAAGCNDGSRQEERGPRVPAGPPPPQREAPSTSGPEAPDARGEGDPKVARFAGFEAPKPAVWLWQPPRSRMRAASYVVPGRDGANQAHLVVFSDIGGGVDANVQRWARQFRTPDQQAVEPILTKMDVDGIPVTVVELAGEYMGMGQNWYTPDQVLLAAVVEAPAGDLFIHLVGETATVEANREAFMTLVRGLRRAE